MHIEHVGFMGSRLRNVKAFYQTMFQATAGELYREPQGFQSYFLTFADGARLEVCTKIVN